MHSVSKVTMPSVLGTHVPCVLDTVLGMYVLCGVCKVQIYFVCMLLPQAYTMHCTVLIVNASSVKSRINSSPISIKTIITELSFTFQRFVCLRQYLLQLQVHVALKHCFEYNMYNVHSFSHM